MVEKNKAPTKEELEDYELVDVPYDHHVSLVQLFKLYGLIGKKIFATRRVGLWHEDIRVWKHGVLKDISLNFQSPELSCFVMDRVPKSGYDTPHEAWERYDEIYVKKE